MGTLQIQPLCLVGLFLQEEEASHVIDGDKGLQMSIPQRLSPNKETVCLVVSYLGQELTRRVIDKGQGALVHAPQLLSPRKQTLCKYKDSNSYRSGE